MKKITISLFTVIMMTTLFFSTGVFAATDDPVGVTYAGHIENIGWQDPVSDGLTAGTIGHSLRKEAIMINLDNAPAGAVIKYAVHVANTGWMAPVENGEVAGTVGESRRIEALTISLENMPGYTVLYRVHSENIGWDQGWVSDGAVAGTTGQSLRVEAVEIKILKKTDVTAFVRISPSKNILVQFDQPINDQEAISFSLNNGFDNFDLEPLVWEYMNGITYLDLGHINPYVHTLNDTITYTLTMTGLTEAPFVFTFDYTLREISTLTITTEKIILADNPSIEYKAQNQKGANMELPALFIDAQAWNVSQNKEQILTPVGYENKFLFDEDFASDTIQSTAYNQVADIGDIITIKLDSGDSKTEEEFIVE